MHHRKFIFKQEKDYQFFIKVWEVLGYRFKIMSQPLTLPIIICLIGLSRTNGTIISHNKSHGLYRLTELRIA